MATEVLVGSRIRERRMVVGLRQADLARKAEISASYLNLIEHNRRRIGGKLLLRIAEVLGVESSVLSEGAEAALLASLREADADAPVTSVEMDRIEEFAGRFPGWAQLLASTHERTKTLGQTVEELSDRIAHDPTLAASVHEVLSTAASIRSTASILAETDALEPEWLDRFHGNINEDSARLAESSRALAGYLEQAAPADVRAVLPAEEVDAYLSDRDYIFDELETENALVDDALQTAKISDPAKALLRPILEIYRDDARHLRRDDLVAAVAEHGADDPLALATTLTCDIAIVLRRLASLPTLNAGYVLCDRAGNLLIRKSIPSFSLPRFGSNCALWPVFQAFSQPGAVLQCHVEQQGRRTDTVKCVAVTELRQVNAYNRVPLMRSGMLIVPSTQTHEAPPQVVGASCRVCVKSDCLARSEPSVLQDGPGSF